MFKKIGSLLLCFSFVGFLTVQAAQASCTIQFPQSVVSSGNTATKCYPSRHLSRIVASNGDEYSKCDRITVYHAVNNPSQPITKNITTVLNMPSNTNFIGSAKYNGVPAYIRFFRATTTGVRTPSVELHVCMIHHRKQTPKS